MNRFATCPLLLVSLLGSADASPPPDVHGMSSDPTTGCRFTVPDELAPGSAVWLGECPGQLADGLGVLRISIAGHKPQLFAGLMQSGQPVRGLVDRGDQATSDYGPAWRFEGAHAIYPETPQQTADGFKVAADAAKAAGRRLAAQGNVASAKFYTGWAKALSEAPGQSE